LRSCPTGTAWGDRPYSTDNAHQLAECSNAGVCDRGSGICRCFEGFTGSSCQRCNFYFILSAYAYALIYKFEPY
jgi:hypothetical protein